MTVDAIQVVEQPAPAPQRARPHLRLALRLVGDSGALPSVSAGAGGIVGVRLGRVTADAGFTGFLPRAARLGDSERGGTFSLLVGTLRGCARWLGDDTLSFGSCVSAELGALRGTGQHLAQPRTARGAWMALGAGPLLRHTGRSGLYTELSLEALVALQRPRFEIDALGEVFQSRRLLVRLTLAAGWTF